MSEESGAFGVTLKGQGQNDPWTTIRANTPEELEDRLTQFVDLELPELVAKTAAAYVTAHNNQPGISAQRDQRAAQPAAAAPSSSPAAGQPRPGLSTSLKLEDDGNYWIATGAYTRDAGTRQARTARAKELGARYMPDEAPASVPRHNGKPERPWKVHTGFVSEENQQELLRLHETGFAEIK